LSFLPSVLPSFRSYFPSQKSDLFSISSVYSFLRSFISCSPPTAPSCLPLPVDYSFLFVFFCSSFPFHPPFSNSSLSPGKIRGLFPRLVSSLLRQTRPGCILSCFLPSFHFSPPCFLAF
jgi:hypothetical protein